MTTRRFADLRGVHRITGLVPVVPTPLNEDESLDEPGLAKLVDFVLQYPFSAIWALASAGEDPHLPHTVIDAATRLFVQHLRGRLPLIVKTSSPGLKETLERTRRMSDMGIDAAAIHFEQKDLGENQARRYFDLVLEESPVPVYVYHNPHRGAQLSLEHLLDLMRHPKVAGMKAGGSNLAELQRLCLWSDPAASVMTAGGGQILAGLAMGAAGHAAIPLLAFPEKAFALLRHLEAGRLKAAQEEQRCMLDFLRGMPKLGNREVNGEVKAVLEIRGVMQRYVTAPFVAATDDQIEQFRELIFRQSLFEALP
jgi:4-hydroxy-tetrahydrodipicolinate synthase